MTERSLGIELWNVPEALHRRISDDAIVCDNILRLLTDYSKAEEEFGKKIRKITTSYSKGQRVEESSLHKAFNALVQNLSNSGCVLESHARNTSTQVLNPLKTLVNGQKKDIDIESAAIEKVRANMNTSKKMIENSWSKYYRCFVQYEAASDGCRRDSENKMLSRIEQQKSKEVADEKKADYETAMQQYAHDISTYNSEYNANLKKVVDALETMDMKNRLMKETLRDLLLKVANMRENMATENLASCTSTRLVFSDFNPKKDHQQMLEKLTDSKMRPLELSLVRLHMVNPRVLKSEPNQLAAYIFRIDDPMSSPLLPKAEKHGLGKYPDYMRSPFIFGLGLNPITVEEMPIIELANRVQTLKSQLEEETKGLNSLENLVQAYDNNPVMGNSKNLRPQVDSFVRRVASIKFQQGRLQTRFEQLGGENKLRLAKIALDQQQKEWEGESARTPQLAGSRTSLNSDSFESEPEEPVPPVSLVSSKVPSSKYIGTAVARYAFEGSGSGYPPFKQHQRFHVVEVESNNSGWTNVVFEGGSIKGFVPTAYVELTLF